MEQTSKEHFSKLNQKFGEVIESSFSSKHEAKLSELFLFSDDLNTWIGMLNGKADTTILISALQEYELGFQAVVSGQYRYAFIAHRYFLERIRPTRPSRLKYPNRTSLCFLTRIRNGANDQVDKSY